jgi:CBS domain-containing protein
MNPTGSFNPFADVELPHDDRAEEGHRAKGSLSSVFLREPVAREVMSKPAIACREHTHFEEVASLLADREISGMPVVDADNRVVGVISERDLAHALGGPLIRLAIRRPVHSGPFLRNTRGTNEAARYAADIMTTPAIVAHPETPLHALAEIMVKEEINRIPVVRDGRLMGVVTRGDVLAAIAGLVEDRSGLDETPIVIGDGT